MPQPELSGIGIVAAGSFNPAIIHPTWLGEKGLLPKDVAAHAMSPDSGRQLIVSNNLSVFTADWLSVQVTQNQASFSTVEMGREADLRDLFRGVLGLLPETPVSAVGINSDNHFRAESEQAWHAFGDQFVPKDFWEPLFEQGQWKERPDGKRVGMRSLTVEVARDDSPGHVRTEIAPSVRIVPHGIFIGINAHFQLSVGDHKGNGLEAGQLVEKRWEETRLLESQVVEHLLGAA